MKNDLKYVLILLFLAFSSSISWLMYFREYRQFDTVDVHSFPKVIGEWRSEDLTISKYDFAIMETKNAVARRYFNDAGEEVSLLIVYSQRNRKVSHPPEICFTGSGVVILSNVIDSFWPFPDVEVKANKILSEQGHSKQITYYWFKVGRHFTPSYWKEQSIIAVSSLLGRHTSNALIRVTADVLDGGELETDQLIRKFSKAIYPYLTQYLP